MKTIANRLRQVSLRGGIVAALLMAVAVPASLLAWGPDRPTFTFQNPAPYVTFNSITDNKKHGDERNFVQIRNYTDNGSFGENVDLKPGKEYEVYVFYHNNASPDLNDAAHNYKGIARNTSMRVQMPATVTANENARVTGFVSASNAKPAQVWDEAYAKNTTGGAVALRYVPNSAKITSEGAVNGKSIDLTKLASQSGAPLGYNALDGNLPGCNKYSGYVTYRFTVDQPNFEISKQVSAAGQNKYVESLKTNAGSKVDYKIKYKNTGTATQNHVTLTDVLPKGVNYEKDSLMYSSSKTNNQWKAATSDALTTKGVDFGAFAPGAALYVKFTAAISKNDDLAQCGANELVNTVTVKTENGSKSDDATVVVDKECVEPEEIEVCDTRDDTIKTVDLSEYEANKDSYTKDLSKCDKRTVEVCNPTTGKIITVDESKKDSYNDRNDEACKDNATPVATELPKTGLSESIMSVLGLGIVTASSYYYVSSRKF